MRTRRAQQPGEDLALPASAPTAALERARRIAQAGGRSSEGGARRAGGGGGRWGGALNGGGGKMEGAAWRLAPVGPRAAAEISAIPGRALGAIVAGWYAPLDADSALQLPVACAFGAGAVVDFDEESCTLLCAEVENGGVAIWVCCFATASLVCARRSLSAPKGAHACYAVDAHLIELLVDGDGHGFRRWAIEVRSGEAMGFLDDELRGGSERAIRCGSERLSHLLGDCCLFPRSASRARALRGPFEAFAATADDRDEIWMGVCKGLRKPAPRPCLAVGSEGRAGGRELEHGLLLLCGGGRGRRVGHHASPPARGH